MSYGAGDKSAKTKTVKVRAHTRQVKVRAPVSDVQSSGGDYGIKQAQRFKATPQYQRATRAAYGVSSPAQKRATLSQPMNTPERRTDQLEHARRLQRNDQLAASRAQHDVSTPADLARANRFLAAHPEILHPQHPQHSVDTLATILNAGGKVASAADQVLSGKTTAGLVSGAANAVGAILNAPGAAGTHLADITANALGFKNKVRDPTKNLVRNFGRDLVDIPANAIPSLYVPARTAAQGHPGKAAGMLAQPFIQTAEHPGKSLLEHPLGTALMLTSLRGGDLAAGSLARKVTGRVEERPPGTVPGTTLSTPRRAAKGLIHHQIQRRMDARSPAPVMKPGEIQRRVDEHVAASEDLRRLHRGQAMQAAKTAIGGRKATAATVLAAQNIAKATPEDLLAYHTDLTHEAQHLTGIKLRANKDTRKQIEKAIKTAGPETQARAEAYSKLNVALQDKLAAHGLYDAPQLEKARLIPYAVRNMGAHHDGEKIVDTHGNPISADHIREHMIANGHFTEPAFVTHAPNQRGARNFFVASHEPPKVPGGVRTGEAVKRGSADIHPDVLVEGNARAQGLVDAADRYGAFVKEFAHRGSAGKVLQFQNYKQARRIADELTVNRDGTPRQFAVAMTPVRLNPFLGRKDQLDALLKHTDAHPGDVSPVHQAIHESLGGQGGDEGGWTLVPADAAKRMQEHIKTLGPGPLGKVGNIYGSMFRRAALSTSPRWLTGNTVEAAMRLMVARAGPRSYLTGRRTLKTLEGIDPKAAEEARLRTTGGGHFSLQRRSSVHTSAEQFAGTKLAGVATVLGKFWRAPGPKQLAELWHGYTDFVFNDFNGRIESQFQTVMLGKALRDSPLMSGHVVKLSHKAIQQAAEGLRGTSEQVALGREVDRMYGRYGKFSPGLRRAVAAYTPFIAWTLNATRFLYDVLPRDHPVLTGLLASANQASQEWRKQHGLVIGQSGAVPGFLMGSIPGKGDSHLRISRYTPFGLMDDPTGNVAGLVLPQLSGALQNLQGKDWRGRDLKGPDGGAPTDIQKALAAAQTLIESSIPAVAQADRVSHNPGNLGQKLNKEFNPFVYTKGKQADKEIVVSRGRAPSTAPAFKQLPQLPPLPPLPPIR
jgi:hypothetical protein